MASTATPGAVLPEGRVLVSNDGGVFDSTANSDAVILEMQIRTAGLGSIEFTDEKQQTLEFAEQQGRNFSRLFGLIGGFTVAAGVLLLVNIFVMLAEERKSELGTLRALGFRRRDLVRVFGIEGTLYSIVAAAAGALAGIAVGRVVVALTEGIFSQGRRGLVGLQFAVTGTSLIAGFAIGLGIALITVWATSARISRLNIIRAIRDTPEPAAGRRRGRQWVAPAAGIGSGALLTAVGVASTQPVVALLGPALVAWGLVPVLGTWLPRRWAISLPCLGVLAYTILAFSLLPSVFDKSDIPVFFVQGIILVLAGVALVVTNDDQFRWVSNRLSAAGGGLATRLGLANPLAKRFRTGLLLGMYALVVFVLVFIAAFAAVLQAQAPRSHGTDQCRLRHARRQQSWQSRRPQNCCSGRTASPRPRLWSCHRLSSSRLPTPRRSRKPITGFDHALLSRGGPTLSARDPRFASDTDAWNAVLASH